MPGNQFPAGFLMSWTKFMHHCYNKGYNFMLSQKYSCNIYYVRNMCLGASTIRGRDQKPFDGKVERSL
jgi:hypothetical protein